MSKPMKQSYFSDFGVSTTPTLVTADRQRVVRLYHPGLMTFEELEAAVVPLLLHLTSKHLLPRTLRD